MRKDINYYLKLLVIFILVYLGILINKEIKITNFLCTILKLISPFVVGVFLAYLLNPIIKKLEKRNIKRKIGTILLYLVILIIFIILIVSLLPLLTTCMDKLETNLPKIIDDINIFINNIINKFNNEKIILNVNNLLVMCKDNVIKIVTKDYMRFISNILSTLSFIGISLIVSFCILIDFDNFRENIFNLIPKKHKKDTIKLLSQINYEFFRFVRANALIILATFILSIIFFLIFKLKAPVFFALFNAITNIIPVIGPYIGAFTIILIGFTGGYKTGIFIIISVIIIQTIESYFISPFIMSKTMKLNLVTILISLLIFGYFFGIIGMIFAEVFAATIKIIILFIDEKYHIFNFKTNDGKK